METGTLRSERAGEAFTTRCRTCDSASIVYLPYCSHRQYTRKQTSKTKKQQQQQQNPTNQPNKQKTHKKSEDRVLPSVVEIVYIE